MEIIVIYLLLVLLTCAIMWGVCYYMWYRDHRFAVDMSQGRAERIKALIGRENIAYTYTVKELKGAFYVIMFDFEIGNIPVKRFYDEDKDYARRCAEELCDKLNETI